MKLVKWLQTTFVASCVAFGVVGAVQALTQEEIEATSALEEKEAKDPDVSKGYEAYWRGDYKTAIKYWTKAAKKGNSLAERRLAERYIEGKGVKQNSKKGLDLAESSCNKGNLFSCSDIVHFLGECAGYDLPKRICDPILKSAKYRNVIAKACTKGDLSESRCAALARRLAPPKPETDPEKRDLDYQKGIEAYYGEKDYKTALKYFTKAAKKGNSQAEERLGFIYLHGEEGIKANHKKALDFYESSCKKGNRGACGEFQFMFVGCAVGQVDCTVLDSPKYRDLILKHCASGSFTESACNSLKKELTILK